MNTSVVILGAGKMGISIAYFLSKHLKIEKIGMVSNKKEDLLVAQKIIGKKLETFKENIISKKIIKIVRDYDLIIGALPGNIGLKSFEIAIKSKKDLIDISDVDYKEYKIFEKIAKKNEIKIIPEAGFSPGLTNLLIGYEYSNVEKVEKIGIKAGTLPRKNEKIFPITWCFFDLIMSHWIAPSVIRNYRTIKLKPFSGYSVELLPGIGKVESFYIDNLSTIPMNIHPKNMYYKVFRPLGFRFFIEYLNSYGFLEEKKVSIDKKKVEPLKLLEKLMTSKAVDNYTILHIDFEGKKGNKNYTSRLNVKSFSKKYEKLNSMQKLVAASASFFVKIMLENNLKNGINFAEIIGNEISITELRRLFKKVGIKIRFRYD